MKSSEKNRFQNAFTVCNVALDSVVSDIFGKSETAITDYLTSDEFFDPAHCVSLLRTIPGVGRNSANTIISEIGTDMNQFGSSMRLCRWDRLTPGNNESAEKKKSVRISCGTFHLYGRQKCRKVYSLP